MNRALSYAHAQAVASDCVFRLDAALDGPTPLTGCRGMLFETKLRVVLVAQLFRDLDWDKAYPEFYMPLAEAVISLGEAIKSTFPDRDGLLCARHYLERILLIDPRKGGRKDVA